MAKKRGCAKPVAAQQPAFKVHYVKGQEFVGGKLVQQALVTGQGQPSQKEGTSRGRSSALLELGRALAPKRQRNTCSNCAHENVSTAKFCGECGAKLDVDLPDANMAEDVHA